jgi:hypothetical protein
MIDDLKLNVKNLEFRVTILEHKVERQNLQDKFETMQIRNKSEITEIPTTSLAMRANESNYIKTSINKTAGCYVEAKISFNNENRIITALIDSGSTHNIIICPTLIPASWINNTHREIIMFAVDNSQI